MHKSLTVKEPPKDNQPNVNISLGDKVIYEFWFEECIAKLVQENVYFRFTVNQKEEIIEWNFGGEPMFPPNKMIGKPLYEMWKNWATKTMEKELLETHKDQDS